MKKKISLHQLVLWICDEEREKYKIQLRPIDYYISGRTGMLVIVEQNGRKIYYHHKSYLKRGGVELDENL